MRIFYNLLVIATVLFSSCNQNLNAPLKPPSIEVHFSPRGGCTRSAVREIQSAKHYVYVAMFCFTSRPLAEALAKAKQRGVDVKVIIDKGTARSRRCVGPMLEADGIPVRYKRGSGDGLMHDKYAIIDGKVVLAGSFNWTKSAEYRNDENLLIIYSKSLAHHYLNNFKRLWSLAGLEN